MLGSICDMFTSVYKLQTLCKAFPLNTPSPLLGEEIS